MAVSKTLALLYRPKVWGELIGNAIYIEMLRNSIIRNEVKQAYFFSGVRGSGKTTVVRIFAKALQCKIPTEQGDPCNECDSCLTIDRDANVDVLEIDAASENKVESIRDLIRTLHFAPISKHKIVILDECHMLSNAASNALLKTLEEPPEHVVFMFCTTDPDKVIDTILSRCLRFDFRRLDSSSIEGRLKVIADREALIYEKEALRIVAQSVNGAMRDAITILDQAQLLSSEISVDVITKIIGFVSFRDVYKLFEAVAADNLSVVTSWFETTVSDKSHTDIVLSVIEFLEQLVLVQAGAMSVNCPDDLKDQVKQMAAAFPLNKIVSMAGATRAALSDIRRRHIPDTEAVIQLLLATIVSIFKYGEVSNQNSGPSLVEIAKNLSSDDDTISRVSLIRKYFEGNLVKVDAGDE